MKDFANRLWGISFTLWFVGVFNYLNEQSELMFYFRIIVSLVFSYFVMFGTSRFEKPYKKII